MQRRLFLKNVSAGLGSLLFYPTLSKTVFAAPQITDELPKFRVRRLTNGPKHHFFGYYGMSPWNKSETKMVCLESSFHDRLPKPGETADIGLVNQENGLFQPITTTTAWNLQQGSLIHWNPLKPNAEFIYNDQKNNELVSVKFNVVVALDV